eukprot:GHVP01059288.1.p1 GENE.GHVP01059288.1~~GHVP01059288.1.p1  ORF type:complete len:233 (+),score=60.42 GHVP01059288.1:52-750(+)
MQDIEIPSIIVVSLKENKIVEDPNDDSSREKIFKENAMKSILFVCEKYNDIIGIPKDNNLKLLKSSSVIKRIEKKEKESIELLKRIKNKEKNKKDDKKNNKKPNISKKDRNPEIKGRIDRNKDSKGKFDRSDNRESKGRVGKSDNRENKGRVGKFDHRESKGRVGKFDNRESKGRVGKFDNRDSRGNRTSKGNFGSMLENKEKKKRFLKDSTAPSFNKKRNNKKSKTIRKKR